MKRLLIVATLVAASTFAFGQPTRSGANQKSSDEQAVRQLLNEIPGALERADIPALDRIYADDYTLVNEHGVLTTKAPRLAAIKSADLKYASVGFDEVNVRLYGNTAVATYRVTSKGQDKGQAIGGLFRATSTYVKMKGRWQLVAAQVSPITSGSNAKRSGEGHSDQMLIDNSRAVWEAYKSRNTAAMRALTADEYVAHTQAGPSDLKRDIDTIEKLTIEAFTIDGPKVTWVTKDVAILNYKCDLKGSFERKPFKTVYATEVWVNRDGKWRIISYTETPLS